MAYEDGLSKLEPLAALVSSVQPGLSALPGIIGVAFVAIGLGLCPGDARVVLFVVGVLGRVIDAEPVPFPDLLGKLSPAQAEKVKARDGLSVESSTEYTYDEQRDSRIARAEAKADRYEGYAKNARERGDSRLDAADKRSERFEFGQPILVGHHSEKGARRDADRIWSDTKKGFEEHKKADDYEHRAKEVVAQASRRKGETEGHRNEVRQRNRSRVKEGTRIQHLIFGEGVVKKINTKTMKVEFDSKAGGGAKFSPNIDYADSFVVKDGGNQA